MADARLQLWLLCEIHGYCSGCGIQYLNEGLIGSKGVQLTRCSSRVGYLQKPLIQKEKHSLRSLGLDNRSFHFCFGLVGFDLGNLRLLLCPTAFGCSSHGEDTRSNDAADECQQDEGSSSNGTSVATNEFAQSVQV